MKVSPGPNGLPLPVTLSASMKSKETRNVTMNLLYGMTADGATIIRQTIMPSCTNAALRSNSIIYLRYADILLLKAEAKIMGEAPDLNGAADIIDRIRNRAGLGKLPQSTRSSKEALLQAYMDERRMELAFEGQRWYDLCRLNKVEEVMNAVYAKDSGRHAQENLFNENSYLLAIPQGAIDQNENLIQNPGY